MTAQQHLLEVSLTDLHPTQMTVGMVEVAAKRAQWSTLKRKERDHLLSTHWFPAVLGPQQRYYIVDHHHLGVALLQEGASSVWVMQLADFSMAPLPLFWHLLEFHQWAHPYDAQGQHQPFSAIPAQLSQLRDDPYRSLSGEVRKAGGYAKDATPFAEFLWAAFFRPQIPLTRLRPNAQGQLDAQVMAAALTLAHSPQARCLPGWSGQQGAASVPADSQPSA